MTSLGRVLDRALDVPRRAGALAGEFFDHLSPGRHRRRIWQAAERGRAHVEVRAIHQPGRVDLARAVERAVQGVEGVHEARVNAVLGRVLVVFDPEGPSLDELVAVIEGVEAAHGVAEDTFPHGRPEHPGDVEPVRREVLALSADLLGLGTSVFGQLLRFAPFPVELASVVSLVDSEPRLRGFFEQHLGAPATDLGLGLSNAVAQALSQGPVGLVVDATHRANLLRESQERRDSWVRRERELFDETQEPATAAWDTAERPAQLPPGPLERYADRATLVSLGLAGAALPLTGSPRRAAGFVVAGLPKAGRMGRDAFAASLGRRLARRDVVVFDRAALRRLDRIDFVLLEAGLLGGRVELNPLAEPLVDAARRGGLVVAVTGEDRATARVAARLGVDVLPGGSGRATVRALQRRGHGVLLVSTDGAALQAADCGVGVAGDVHGQSGPRGTGVPWGAHVLTCNGLADAHMLIEAVTAARGVSSRSAVLAAAGSGIGAVWSLIGPATSAGRRAALPVNAAAMAAQLQGIAAGEALGRRQVATPRAHPAWHALDVPAVLAALGTSPEGLSPRTESARPPARRQAPVPLPLRLPAAVAAELANPLTPVLGIGAGLAAAVGSVTDAALVASVMGVNAAVGGVQRLRAEVSIERLMRVSTEPVTVRRGGAGMPLAPDELVPGDVVELESGDLVPADCRVLESLGCEVDESVLTGESLPVRKDSIATPGAEVADRRCMLFEGTTISTGRALAVVVAVGTDTEVGSSLADAPAPPPSGVEARLGALTGMTVPVTLASGAAVGAMSFLRGRGPRRAITSGVSLMVAAVPEGLPLLASMAQLSSARRLSRRGALVRNPRTIEALGRVDTLCFDKTGTLTLGAITVQRVSDGATDERVARLSARSRAVLAAAVRASPGELDGPHATDRAILAGALDVGVSAAHGMGAWRVLGELAFDPARGYHAVVGTGPAGHRVSVKGAPEVILPRCTSWLGPDGPVPLTAPVRRRLDKEADRLAQRGLRVLAVAERASSQRAEVGDERVNAMELMGFLGLADSVRPAAAAAVADLRAAGIDVVMVTGDHPSTARAIGAELDMVNGHRVLTGTELAGMTDEQLDAVVDDVSIFARVTPKDKVRIVRAYQRVGRTVAMTGDGANDAPAIRLAHAGIALGERSAAAAREAADLVVVDDRIETIEAAVLEGRALWASVRDAVAILVGGNLGEVAFTVSATAVSGGSPLGARQLLLVNLLTDMLPAMTIAMRPPPGQTPEALLHEGPDASLGSALTSQIALRAATTAGGALGAWFVARGTGTARRASTVALVALVGTQLGQTAVVGGTSPSVVASSAVSAAALAAVVQTPGVSQFFGCTPLGPLGWTIGVGAAATATGLSVVAPWVLAHRIPERLGRSSSALGEIFDLEARRPVGAAGESATTAGPRRLSRPASTSG